MFTNPNQKTAIETLIPERVVTLALLSCTGAALYLLKTTLMFVS